MEAKTARVTEVVEKTKAKVGARGEGPSSPERQEAAKQAVRAKVGAIKEARRGGRGGDRPEPKEQPEAKGRPERNERPQSKERGGARGEAKGGGNERGAYRAALLKRRGERQAASKEQG